MLLSFQRLAAALLASSLLAAVPAAAAELSLVSGLYRSEKNKVGGTNTGKSSTIDLGARFADIFDTRMQWFVQAAIETNSYESGASGASPGDGTGIRLGGGMRYDFDKLTERVNPFVYGYGEYRNVKEATQGGVVIEEVEDNGLFYGGVVGLRLSLNQSFFLDIESQLFESALFATRKTETTTVNGANGQTTKTDSESTRTELHVSTLGAFSDVKLALGLRF